MNRACRFGSGSDRLRSTSRAKQFLELRRAGFAQPLEHDHLAVHDIDAGLQQARERKAPARLGARATASATTKASKP